MNLSEHDARCNDLFKQLDALKEIDADKIHGGEYDSILRELRATTRNRMNAITFNINYLK